VLAVQAAWAIGDIINKAMDEPSPPIAIGKRVVCFIFQISG